MVEDFDVTRRETADTVRVPPQTPDIPHDAAAAALDRTNYVGKYVRVAKLGAGAMGEVWKAFDPDLRRWVALKQLKNDDPSELARALREAQTCARLSHPNIAGVYETGEHEGRPFIAMQFIDGRTLGAHPRDDRRLLVELVRDAARALQHAHEIGIVHRDIKPANIMVAGRRVYILDFGLARQLQSKSSLSQTGMIVGTPSYMSPEQAKGERADARSDVYALGATLYELFSGRPPFRDENVYKLLNKIASEDASSLRRLDPRTDGDLDTIVMKCLEKDAGRRYETAAALADDLGRWLAGEAILAHPPSTFYRLRKKIAKRASVLLGLAIGLVATVVVSGIVIPKWRGEVATRAQREKELAEERDRGATLKELAALWTEVVLVKQGLHREALKPGPVRADLRAALERVDAFVAAHSSLPQGYYVRGHARLFLDDYAGAASDALASVELDGRFVPGLSLFFRAAVARRLRDRQLWGAADPDPFGLDALSRDALQKHRQSLVSAGPLSKATAWGLARTPEDTANELLMGAIAGWIIDGEIQRFGDALLRARVATPSEVFSFFLAITEIDDPNAVALLDEALHLMPHWTLALLARARLHWQLKDAARCERDLRHAAEVCPDYAAPLARFAWVLARSGKPEEALPVADRAIELEPKLALAWITRGDANRYLRRRPEAEADYSKAIELAPADYEARYARGLVREDLGNIDGAVEDYTAAIRAGPNEPHAYTNRGSIRRTQGRLNESLADHDRAIELSPKFPEAYANRAGTRKMLDDFKGAAADYRRALAVAPAPWPHRKRVQEMLRELENAGY